MTTIEIEKRSSIHVGFYFFFFPRYQNMNSSVSQQEMMCPTVRIFLKRHFLREETRAWPYMVNSLLYISIYILLVVVQVYIRNSLPLVVGGNRRRHCTPKRKNPFLLLEYCKNVSAFRWRHYERTLKKRPSVERRRKKNGLIIFWKKKKKKEIPCGVDLRSNVFHQLWMREERKKKKQHNMNCVVL